MKNPKSFFKKLKKLIEQELPETCELAYDIGSCELFVIKKDAEFHDKSSGPSGTSWHGVLSPSNCPSSDDGYVKESIIGEGIYINMAAVQSEY